MSEGFLVYIMLFLSSLQIYVSAGIESRYWLDDRGFGVRDPVGQEFSLLPVVQTGSGVHPTFYPMGNGGSFPGCKAAGA
jgi:hypothetical protein